jgi:hypothetical protein
MLKPGDTFLIPKSSKDIEHLWIVLTPEREDGTALCVNVTSWKFDRDETVILQPGDHPFITKKSVVHYEDAQFMPLARVEQLLAMRSTKIVCEQKHCCTYKLIERLREGLLKSKRTAKGIKEYCRSLWEPEEKDPF